MKITIGFSRPHKFKIFSCLIRLWEGTPYSHIFIRRHSKWLDSEYVYQASGLSVNFMGAKHFDSINKTIDAYELEFTDEQVKTVMQFAMKTAGKPYGMKQIFAILLTRFGIKSKDWLDGEYSYICSELVAKILQDYKDVRLDKPIDLVTPKDIHRIMEKKYASNKISV